MEISVRELKNHLSKYLRHVQAGEEVVVTSHKCVVAKLVPPDRAGRLRAEDEHARVKRLKSLPWVRWSGGKPPLRPGVRVKRGGKSVAESLLADRR
jgi:prevent-host-death family protein